MKTLTLCLQYPNNRFFGMLFHSPTITYKNLTSLIRGTMSNKQQKWWILGVVPSTIFSTAVILTASFDGASVFFPQIDFFGFAAPFGNNLHEAFMQAQRFHCGNQFRRRHLGHVVPYSLHGSHPKQLVTPIRPHLPRFAPITQASI